MVLALVAFLIAVEGARAEDSPAPTMTNPAKPTYEGGLTKGEIQKSITPVMPNIKACYEVELGRDGALAGKLMMTWVITGEGAVTDATVAQNTFRGERAQVVGDCVKNVISGLTFVKPEGGGKVFVTYPFVFSSSVDPRPQLAAAPSPPFGCGLFTR